MVAHRGWVDAVDSASAWAGSTLGLRYILWGGRGRHVDGVHGCMMAQAWHRCQPGVACGGGCRDVSGMAVARRQRVGCVVIGAGAREGHMGHIWDGGSMSHACRFLFNLFPPPESYNIHLRDSIVGIDDSQLT